MTREILMSAADQLFLDACGATGPPELAWDDWNSEGESRLIFNRPAVIVGRSPVADLCLAHPVVGKRHAYLQMVEGRFFAIDLDSRSGLHWSGVPRRSGWFDAGRPIQIGPTAIRVVSGDQPGDDEPGPSPLSRRFASRHQLPRVTLQIRDADGRVKRWSMDRVLVLVGRSATCGIRLADPKSSRYACALVRTPRGVWMVDLLSSQGVTVNGAACRQARLEDGDKVQMGEQLIRLNYEGASARSGQLALSTTARPSDTPTLPALNRTGEVRGLLPEPDQDAWELVPELILRQIQEGGVSATEPTAAPLGHALMMLVRLVGEIHKDHLNIIREEAEQIRRLNREMGALRAQTPGSELPAQVELPAPGLSTTAGAIGAAADASPHRPAPQEVQALVGERLAAWDRERRSRWRNVVGLLVGQS